MFVKYLYRQRLIYYIYLENRKIGKNTYSYIGTLCNIILKTEEHFTRPKTTNYIILLFFCVCFRFFILSIDNTLCEITINILNIVIQHNLVGRNVCLF